MLWLCSYDRTFSDRCCITCHYYFKKKIERIFLSFDKRHLMIYRHKIQRKSYRTGKVNSLKFPCRNNRQVFDPKHHIVLGRQGQDLLLGRDLPSMDKHGINTEYLYWKNRKKFRSIIEFPGKCGLLFSTYLEWLWLALIRWHRQREGGDQWSL